MSLAALPIARPDFNRRRIFLLPPFKINTAGTPHRRIIEDVFKCPASPSHPAPANATRIAYLFAHRTFGITLRELMTRMENERNCKANPDIELFYFHPGFERNIDFNTDFS